MAFKLAELFVQFTAKGVEALKGQLDKVQESMEKVKAGAEAVGRVAGIAFASLTGTVGGLATAGFAGSVQMEALHMRLTLLSREIAGLFVPQMRVAIETIERATTWFRKLTGEQQQNIVRWIEAAAAGLGVAMVMPKVFAGINLVIGGVKSLTLAFLGFEAATGALLPLLGAAATAMAGIYVASKVNQEGFAGLTEEIASKFQPQIEAVIDKIGQLVSWFRNLTDAQIANIVKWVEGAAAATAVLFVLPKLFAGIQFLVAGIGELTAAFTTLDIASGGILPIIGAVVTGITALAVGTKVGREGLTGLWEAIEPVRNVLGELWAALRLAFDEVKGPVMEAIGSMTEALGNLMEAVRPLIPAIAEAFARPVIIAIETMAFAVKIAADTFNLLYKGVLTVVDAVGLLAEKIDALIDKVPLLRKIADMVGVSAGLAALETVGRGADRLLNKKREGDTDYVSTIGGDFGEKKSDRPRTEVVPARVGTEAITATLSRLQQASLKADYDKQNAKNLADVNENTKPIKQIWEHLKSKLNPQPAFAP